LKPPRAVAQEAWEKSQRSTEAILNMFEKDSKTTENGGNAEKNKNKNKVKTIGGSKKRRWWFFPGMRIERVAQKCFKVCYETTERFVSPRLEETENFTKLEKKNRAVWKLCCSFSLLLLAQSTHTHPSHTKTSQNKMAVDKAPGKKDKLTDAEKKKQKQENKVRLLFFC